MSTSVNSTHTSVPASSRTPTIPANHSLPESAYTNGHHHHHHHDVGPQSGSASMGKKGKQKKATDPTEASNLIAAKISQLESDAAGDKEQEAEIGWLRRPICYVCMVLIDVPSMRADLPEVTLCGNHYSVYLVHHAIIATSKATSPELAALRFYRCILLGLQLKEFDQTM
jgi:hypothetical protein